MPPLSERDSVVRATGASGFTLIEVLVALSVLSIGIVPLFVALRGPVNQLSAAEHQHRATLLLQTLLETSALAPPQACTLEGRSPEGTYEWRLTTRVWDGAGLGGLTADPEAESLLPAARETPDASLSPALLEITASVAWHEPGRRRRIEATALVPEKVDTNRRSLGEDVLHSVLTGNAWDTRGNATMYE